MTKDRLLEVLLRVGTDPESHHSEAEDALLEYVNDPEIKEAWEEASENWWYA